MYDPTLLSTAVLCWVVNDWADISSKARAMLCWPGYCACLLDLRCLLLLTAWLLKQAGLGATHDGLAAARAHASSWCAQAFSVALSGPMLGQAYPIYVWLSLVPIVAGCAMSAMKEVQYFCGCCFCCIRSRAASDRCCTRWPAWKAEKASEKASEKA